MADITKMFHQVRVRPEDASAYRYFWREPGSADPPDVNRVSCFYRIVLVTAYVCRWISNLRSVSDKREGDLTVEEIDRARFALLRYVQQQSFQPELDALRAGRPVPMGSSLGTLRPFVNEAGLLVLEAVSNMPTPRSTCLTRSCNRRIIV